MVLPSVETKVFSTEAFYKFMNAYICTFVYVSVYCIENSHGPISIFKENILEKILECHVKSPHWLVEWGGEFP